MFGMSRAGIAAALVLVAALVLAATGAGAAALQGGERFCYEAHLSATAFQDCDAQMSNALTDADRAKIRRTFTLGALPIKDPAPPAVTAIPQLTPNKTRLPAKPGSRAGSRNPATAT